MKTEISRDSHRPERRYSGVYQQQGRMLTDADWNELVEILKERLDDSLKDVVGNGSPLHRNVVDNDVSPPKLKWGYVYVDGIRASVRPDGNATLGADFEYEHQQDFPSPPASPNDHVLYADVWERTVTYLMDERLRDKGLHGADTATRKQTLAQVKWCDLSVDPEQSTLNPAKGDAELSLTMLHKSTESDPCDPCADQLDVESRTGNYLFRVEVHDVEGDADNPDKITLKWSSENGAEQFEALATKEEMPAGFISDKWIYEFYDETTEKHLGVHLQGGSWDPARGVLTEVREPSDPYAVPAIPGSSETKTFVRRWDGYCTLDLTATDPEDILEEGVDRGVALSTSKAADALGFVAVGASLEINLAAIRLDLSLQGKTFVAGDYWLADVREAEHDPLDPEKSKLIEDALPAGIEHHYFELGTVASGVLEANPEADRKYGFPALTEMTRMFMAGGDGQEVVPNEALPQPLRVAVANGEWPVKGASVRFAIEEGTGGSLSPVNGGLTDEDGIAECVWTPGNAVDDDFRVKATLVDPDDSGSDLDHPPVYFYANLVNADQVAYEPGCPVSGENAVHSLLAGDPAVGLELGLDNYYTVKEVLDALLCKLGARHIPYQPGCPNSGESTVHSLLGEDPTVGLDLTDGYTVKEVLDALLCKLGARHIPYGPACPDSGNTMHGLLAGDSPAGLVLGSDGSYTIKEVLDAVLCSLRAKHIPYDPTNLSRWEDINLEEGAAPPPDTVQKAIDALVDNLQSEDISYPLPDCSPATHTLKDYLEPLIQHQSGDSAGRYRIRALWDALLCNLDAAKVPYNPNESAETNARWRDILEQTGTGDLAEPNTVQEAIDSLLVDFKATDLPIDRSVDLCEALKDDPNIKSVQDAIHKLCTMDRGGGCAVTVGDGLTLEEAFAKLEGEPRISICLLPGEHVLEKDPKPKESIAIDGHGSATVLLMGHRSLTADEISLNGIHFIATDSGKATDSGTGNLTLSSAAGRSFVVEHCTFTRSFPGSVSDLPLVIVRETGRLSWESNQMFASVQNKATVDATLPDRNLLPPESFVAYDQLQQVLIQNPYADLQEYDAKVQAAAKEISSLSGETRTTWFAQRPVAKIDTLPTTVIRPTTFDIGAPIPVRGTTTPTADLARRAALTLPTVEVSPKDGVNQFYTTIFETTAPPTVSAVANEIWKIALIANTPDFALALDPNVSGWISNNQVSGYVALYRLDEKPGKALSWASTLPLDSPRTNNKRAWAKSSLPKIWSPAGQLNLHGNAVAAVFSMMPEATVNDIETVLSGGGAPNISLAGYESLIVTDNVFFQAGSSFVGQSMNVSGNQFPKADEKDAVAYALGLSGVVVGNQSFDPAAPFEEILTRGAHSANLLQIVV